MKVNAMPGLVSDESDKEESYGDLYAMQPKNICFYCKGTSHVKRDSRKLAEWGKRNPVQWHKRIQTRGTRVANKQKQQQEKYQFFLL